MITSGIRFRVQDRGQGAISFFVTRGLIHSLSGPLLSRLLTIRIRASDSITYRLLRTRRLRCNGRLFEESVIGRYPIFRNNCLRYLFVFTRGGVSFLASSGIVPGASREVTSQTCEPFYTY